MYVDDEELFEIYIDYLGSSELGTSVASFKKYAEKYKEENYKGIHASLALCLEIVESMFFKEVAWRYFKVRTE
jgi:hypothetical protein